MTRSTKVLIIAGIFIALISVYYSGYDSNHKVAKKAVAVASYADKEINLLPNWGVNNFVIDSEDNIWFPGLNMTNFDSDFYKKSNTLRQTSMYITRYVVKTKTLTSFELEGEIGMEGGNQSFIEIDSDNDNIYVSRWLGKHIWQFNTKTHSSKKLALPKINSILKNRPTVNISSLAFINGMLWIGIDGSNSFVSLNSKDLSFNVFEAPEWLYGIRFVQKTQDENKVALPVNYLVGKAESGGVETDGRIAYFNIASKQFELTDQRASAFYINNKNGDSIYVELNKSGASENKLFGKLQVASRSGKNTIELQNGVQPGDSVQQAGILTDENGNIWVDQILDIAKIDINGQQILYKIPRQMGYPHGGGSPTMKYYNGGEDLGEIPNNPGVGKMQFDSTGRLWIALTNFGQLGYLEP